MVLDSLTVLFQFVETRKNMKISKITLGISFVIVIVLVILVGRISYSIGQHNASLTVKEATPKELAEAMQNDNFYGEYSNTMLLVSGTVEAVIQQNVNTIVKFAVTDSPSALGTVSCSVENNQTVKIGENIRFLTDAHDAVRQHSADIYMPNCYVINL